MPSLYQEPLWPHSASAMHSDPCFVSGLGFYKVLAGSDSRTCSDKNVTTYLTRIKYFEAKKKKKKNVLRQEGR